MTANSFKLIGLTIICFLMALATGWSIFFHLTYMLVSITALAALWSYLNIRDVTLVRQTRTYRGVVGEPIEEIFMIQNNSFFPRLWLEITDQSDLPNYHASCVVTIGPYKLKRWQTHEICNRRGAYRLGPVILTTGDPFGFFRFRKNLNTTAEIIIYPRTIGLSELTVPMGELLGGHLSRRRSFSNTPNISSLREYVQGDSFNRISWPATARQGKLIVKEFELDPTADIWLLLDLDRQVHHYAEHPTGVTTLAAIEDNTLEYAVSLIGSLTQLLIGQDRSVGMLAWGAHRHIVPCERGGRQFLKVIEELALVQDEGRRPLTEVLLTEGSRFTRNSTLMVVTSSLDEKWVYALQSIRQRGVKVAVLLIEGDTFDGRGSALMVISALASLDIANYLIKRGPSMPQALAEGIATGELQRRRF